MGRIHPTALVEAGARLGADVEIGAYSLVGPEVVLGDGVVLGGHAMVTGRTTIGPRTQIFSFASIGGPPQDITYRGEPTSLIIGADCLIRENVTIHLGTVRGKGVTSVGSHCYLMAGCHVAHDCVLADHVTLVNNVAIGGHVEIGEHAIVGGLSAVQQRVRIGAFAFVGGHSGITAHLIPFGMALGRGARLAGVNVVGMRRNGFDAVVIERMEEAYAMLFNAGAGRVANRVDEVDGSFADTPAIREVTDFIRVVGAGRLCVPVGKIDEHYAAGAGDQDNQIRDSLRPEVNPPSPGTGVGVPRSGGPAKTGIATTVVES